VLRSWVRLCQYLLNCGIHYFATMKPKDKETGSLFVQLLLTKCAVRSLYSVLYVRRHIGVPSWILSFMHLLPI
jgi:hypothetical protein